MNNHLFLKKVFLLGCFTFCLCRCTASQPTDTAIQESVAVADLPSTPTLQWQLNHHDISSGSSVGGTISLSIHWVGATATYLEISSSLPALLPYSVHANDASSVEVSIPTKSLFGSTITSMPFDARVADNQGAIVHQSLILVADNRGPQFSATTLNGSTTALQSGVVTVAATVVSPLQLQEISVVATTFEGTSVIKNLATDAGQFQGTFNSTLVADQKAQLHFHAVDIAGNEAFVSLPIAINNVLFDTVQHYNNSNGNIEPTEPFDYASNYLLISDLNHDGIDDISFSRQEPGLFPGNLFTIFNPLSGNYSISNNWWNYLPGSSHWAPIGAWGHHRGLVSCDTNHDNNQDALWVANQPGGDFLAQVSIAYGPQSSTGQFSGYQILSLTDGVPAILTCADLNGDQQAEILYRERVNYYPYGNGQFRNFGNAATTNIVGPVGDIDGDGQVDIAIIDNNTTFKIAYGPINKNGPLTYSPPLSRNPFPNGAGALIQGVGDLNQDGYDDILLPDFTGTQPHNGNDAVKIYWGQGTRTQTLQATTITHPAAAEGVQFFAQSDRGIESADFNGDGKLDLAVFAQQVSSGAQEIDVLLGPNFTATYRIPAPPYLHPNAKFGFVFSANDFNHDERSELVVVVPSAYASGEGELLIYRDQVP